MTDQPRPDEPDLTDSGSAVAAPEEPGGKKLRQEVDIKDAGPCKKHIRVSVDREDIDDRMREHFSKLMLDSAVPGYRPGKAPRKLVERRFHKDVGDQVKSEVLMASLEQLGQDHEVAPLSPPNLDLEKIQIPESGPMIYEFEVEVRPSFDLPEYRGMKLKRPTRAITEADLGELRRHVLAPHGQVVPKEDGQAALGDILVAEVAIRDNDKEVGKIPEAQFRVERELAFKDGLAPRFGDQVGGARAGDKREVDVVLSSQAAAAWRGRAVKAVFDVKDVKTVRLPRADPRVPAGADRAVHARPVRGDAARHPRPQPPARPAPVGPRPGRGADHRRGRLGFAADLLRRQARKALNRRLMEMRADGMPPEQIKQESRRLQQDVIASTAAGLKEHFVLQKIAEVEKIEVDEDDLNDEIERIAAQSDESPRKVKARLEKDDMMDALASEMIERKALDLILDSAEYEDVPMDEQEQPASQSSTDAQAVHGEMADPDAAPPEAAEAPPS